MQNALLRSAGVLYIIILIPYMRKKGEDKMPVSESKRRNNDNYNAKCDYISIRPLKETGAEIRAAAAAAGQSLQGYILQAVRERMARDQAQAAGAGLPSTEDAPTPAQD